MRKPEQTPYLTISLGSNNDSISWYSHDQVKEWLTQINENWQWLSDTGNPEFGNVRDEILSKLTEFLGKLEEAERKKQHELSFPEDQESPELLASQDQFTQITSDLETFFRTNFWLVPNNAYGSYISDLRHKEGSDKACIVVAYLRGRELGGYSPNLIIPMLVECELFIRGFKDKLGHEEATFNRLKNKITTYFNQYKNDCKQQNEVIESLRENIAEHHNQQILTFEATEQSYHDRSEQQFQKWEQMFEELRKTYSEYMNLAAPVEYWDGKRQKHQKWIKCSFATLLLTIGGAVWLIIKLTNKETIITIMQAVTSIASENDTGTTITASIPWFINMILTTKISLYILAVTLIFWAIRLVTRLLLSQIHLENDATERVTMAKTYLALIKDSFFERQAHTGTILNALFRPSSDGVVKDEELPVSILESIARVFKR